jgi:hypothetical protein
LADRHRQDNAPPRTADPGAVERIAPPIRLVGHGVKIRRDRPTLSPKSNQLRMMRVSAGQPGEHRLRQQPLPPNREQSFDV